MRLAIGSSYWLIIWMPPRLEPLRILAGCLAAPVLTQPPNALSVPYPAPLDLPNDKSFETLSAPRLTRSRDTDATGRLAVGWHQPSTLMRFHDIDTVLSYQTTADHLIYSDDPNSARTVRVHHMTIERPHGIASVTSRTEATCNPDITSSTV
ncbi:MAG: hypothetical protein AAGK79_08075 [Pseudomonadota bacterium]